MLKLLLIALIAAAVGATGCAEKYSGTPRVEILPSIATRVTSLHFDPGDQIGLSIVKGSAPYAENQMMTYNGTAFTAEGLLWYNDLNEKSTLTAYHPYSASGVPAEFSVATDQTTAYAASDLLGAHKTEVTPATAPIGMIFRHLMSEVRIIVTNSSSAAVTGITVGGSIPAAEVDFSSLSVRTQAGAQAADIRANEVTVDAAYRVTLVPQTATLTLTVQTADGKSRSKGLASATLESGKRYDVAVAVTNTDISVLLSGDIEDWGDGGTLEGSDSSSPEPSPEPSPGETLEYRGQTYRTRIIDGRVWMADNLRYQPSGTTIGSGVWHPVGGVPALATQGLLYDYATATSGGSSTQGICPPGWHIPSIGELTSLCDAGLGSDFFVVAGCWTVTTMGEKMLPDVGYLMAAPLNAGGKCDCLGYGAGFDTPRLSERFDTYGISVRCVKNL